MRLSGFAIWAAATAQQVSALTGAQWRSQSIYQVVTDRFARTDGSTSACNNWNDYCGGTWQGLINKLDYIQDMGFTAIWISPVVKNVEGLTNDGSSYHGYWAQDLYQVNQHYGSASDLKALSAALHQRGMYLMVDIVVNHMASISTPSNVDYASYYPFNDQKYFHPYCPIDWNSQTSTEVCWMGDDLVPLVDIKTEDSTVRSMYHTWISQLVSNYSIDGLRLDTTAEVEKAFYPSFVSAAGVYIVGEIFNGNPDYTCDYQKYLPAVLNYPAWYWITQAFQNTTGSISNLANGISTMKSTCSDTTLLGSFLENHDNPRFPSLTSDQSLVKNAIAFTTLSDGIPIIYNGQEQGFSGSGTPSNREPLWTSGYATNTVYYQHIAKLNKFRNQAIKQSSDWVTSKASAIYTDASTIVMRKGATGSQSISVFSNKGSSSSSYSFTLSSSETGFTASQTLVDILSCKTATTDASGNLAVTVTSGLPLVFYPQSLLSGSGICSPSSGNPSTTATAVTTTKATSTQTSTFHTSTTSSAAISHPSSASITFTEQKTTIYGETIKVAGSVPQLGSWDVSTAIALNADTYTAGNPVWSGTVSGFVAGQSVEYKYVKIGTDGSVTWEAGQNHVYNLPKCGNGKVTDVWQE